MSESAELVSHSPLGVFIPRRLHTRLAGTLADNLPDIAAIETERTIVHETVHYLQTMFSGFGQLVWRMHQQATNVAINLWKTHTGDRERKPFPIAYLLANSSVKSAAQIAIELRIISSATEFINLRHAVSPPDGVIGDLLPGFPGRDWHVAPEVTLSNGKYRLQGADILENHAVYLERLYSTFALNRPLHEFADISVLPRRYSSAREYCWAQLGASRDVEFPILCDLSLQIGFADFMQSEEAWRASHPAWRFVMLMDAAKNIDGTLIPRSMKEIPDKYADYATALLRACRFQSVDSVLDERRSVLPVGRNMLEAERVMLDALDFRKERPWCLANPFDGGDTWGRMARLFRPPFTEIDGELFNNSETPGLEPDLAAHRRVYAEQAVMDLSYQALAQQILGEFSPQATREGKMECAFSAFDIPRACPYQVSDFCTGRFKPQDGVPFPISQDGEVGCPFGVFLRSAGIDLASIDFKPETEAPDLVAILNMAELSAKSDS